MTEDRFERVRRVAYAAALWESHRGSLLAPTHLALLIRCLDDLEPGDLHDDIIMKEGPAFIPSNVRVNVTLEITKVRDGTMKGDTE
jgi:hypothetical protein